MCDAMAISLECKCGKKLQVTENLAGKMLQCPACFNAVRVPLPAAPPSPLVEDGQAAARPPLAHNFAGGAEQAQEEAFEIFGP